MKRIFFPTRTVWIVCLVMAGSLTAFGQPRSIDDGFTWFQAVATEALGQNNIPYSTGWVLKSHNVNLYFNSFIVDLEIPAGGSPLDKRLDPTATAKGFFYGMPWTSAEGKAMAARVPKKGTPYPVPSTQVK